MSTTDALRDEWSLPTFHACPYDIYFVHDFDERYVMVQIYCGLGEHTFWLEDTEWTDD